MRRLLKGTFDAAVLALAASLAARAAAADPRSGGRSEIPGPPDAAPIVRPTDGPARGRPGPFGVEPGREWNPETLGVAACRVAARSHGGLEFARSDSGVSQARARARARRDAPGLFVSVVTPGGRPLSAEAHVPEVGRIATALWADVNADGREDFVLILLTGAETPGGPACELCFAMSSSSGYAVTVVKSVAPAASDFVRLGPSRSAFVQASFVCGQSGEGEGAVFAGYYVFNLLDLTGERPVLSSADPLFPRWIAAAGGEPPPLTDDEKALLWMAEPDRIFARERAALDGSPTSRPLK